jgi:hypothetical protein
VIVDAVATVTLFFANSARGILSGLTHTSLDDVANKTPYDISPLLYGNDQECAGCLECIGGVFRIAGSGHCYRIA